MLHAPASDKMGLFVTLANFWRFERAPMNSIEQHKLFAWWLALHPYTTWLWVNLSEFMVEGQIREMLSNKVKADSWAWKIVRSDGTGLCAVRN